LNGVGSKNPGARLGGGQDPVSTGSGAKNPGPDTWSDNTALSTELSPRILGTDTGESTRPTRQFRNTAAS